MRGYLFPGQGWHKIGMLERLLKDASKIDQFILNNAYYVINAMKMGPCDALNKISQASIFVASILEFLERRDSYEGCLWAGHSLGEYSALVASGAIDFKTGLEVVMKRNEISNSILYEKKTAMFAIDFISEAPVNISNIAAYNSKTQIVLSGLEDELISQISELKNIKCVKRLNLELPFHSKLMGPLVDEFFKFIKQKPIYNPAKLQFVVSNHTGQPFTMENVYRNLSLQLMHPVKWRDTIKYMQTNGCREFITMGPKGLLSRFLNK